MRTFKYDIHVVFLDPNGGYTRIFILQKSIELYTHNPEALSLLYFIKKSIWKKYAELYQGYQKVVFLPVGSTSMLQEKSMDKQVGENLLTKSIHTHFFHTHLITDP